jgi:hypothetical protein
MTARIDRTDKPTLRYRHFGRIEPMSQDDWAFARRKEPQPKQGWWRWGRG